MVPVDARVATRAVEAITKAIEAAASVIGATTSTTGVTTSTVGVTTSAIVIKDISGLVFSLISFSALSRSIWL